MPQHRETQASQSPPLSCGAVVVLLVLVVVGLAGIWWLFVRVIVPVLPQHVIFNPELHPGVGRSLWALKLDPLSGNPPQLDLAAIHGRVVLLSFWGTWCPPCRAELPHLAELRNRFAAREDFLLAAISYPPVGQYDDLDSLREETELLLKKLNLDLPTYHDPGDNTRAVVDRLIGFEGFPTNVLLDRRGVIRAVWVGYRPGVETEIERYIDNILSESEEVQQPPTGENTRPEDTQPAESQTSAGQ